MTAFVPVIPDGAECADPESTPLILPQAQAVRRAE